MGRTLELDCSLSGGCELLFPDSFFFFGVGLFLGMGLFFCDPLFLTFAGLCVITEICTHSSISATCHPNFHSWSVHKIIS